jgi:hypothetical protein
VVDEVGQNVGDVLRVVQEIGEGDVQVGRQVLHVHAKLAKTDVGLRSMSSIIRQFIYTLAQNIQQHIEPIGVTR